MKEVPIKKSNLNEETIHVMYELGEVLREIHVQLLSEGYVFKNGVLIKPDESK
jgi:hypothetical protein